MGAASLLIVPYLCGVVELLGIAAAREMRGASVMLAWTLVRLPLVVALWMADGRPPLPASGVALAGMSAVVGVTEGHLYFSAMRTWPASTVSSIASAYPLVVAVLAWALLREPMTPVRVASIVAIVAGGYGLVSASP